MARLPFPNGVPYGAVRASASQESGTEKEYRVIFEAFRRFILHYENSAERLDIMEDIITLRASFLIDRALTGLRIDLDHALEILRNHNDFTTERERLQRDILIAAIDNLVDFAAAEEYAMFKDMPETVDERDMEAYGKSEFPPELIPPIEWGCRCYLVADGFAAVRAALPVPENCRKRIDPVFWESLATGGRIFSRAHRYFDMPLPEHMTKIVKRIKEKFHAKDNTR